MDKTATLIEGEIFMTKSGSNLKKRDLQVTSPFVPSSNLRILHS